MIFNKITSQDVAEWILDNKDVIKEEIALRLHRPAGHLFPQEIYQQQYKEGVLSLIRQKVAKDLNLNGEEILILVTISLIKKVDKNLLVC